MPPQIKHDLNRSGWETTDFPSVCENCLPENPYVQMLKEDHGAECKICTRPFTIFRWKADRTARQKRTNICLTCARLKNCCQCCMLDLSFGLPLAVRDAALKMVAPGPQSAVNREYFAQENEKAIEDGGGGLEAYEKTDEKARDLLRRLANSEPYHKRQRRLEGSEPQPENQLERYGDHNGEGDSPARRTPGPIRTNDARGRGSHSTRGHPYNGRGGRPFPSTSQLPPGPQDILPPRDKNITSLFVTGVEDDLPEHAIRSFFTPFGTLRSIICSHRSHCAFINYAERDAAEKAAGHCQGKAVIAGCPLRVQWGRPKPLDSLDTEERMRNARQGRDTAKAIAAASACSATDPGQRDLLGVGPDADAGGLDIAPPPGQEVRTADFYRQERLAS